MSQQWQQFGNEWRYGDMTAERVADDNAFVITGFGAAPDPDNVFPAIQAAMAFGQIRLRITRETRPVINQLTADLRIK